MEVRRTIGLRRPDEPSWYRDLWRRHNAGPSEIAAPVSLDAEGIKALYLEMVQLHKEISLLAFAVSGIDLVPNREAVPDMAAGATEQIAK